MLRTAFFSLICCLSTLGFAGPNSAGGQELSKSDFTRTDLDFFEKSVRPLLAEKCLKCHGRDSSKIKGGLNLTTRAGVLRGGDSGPAIVPGDPKESLLIEAVRYELLEMPPDGKLLPEEIETLVEWIQRGAPDPRSGAAPNVEGEKIDLEEARQFWAFQPPRKTEVPAVKDRSWPATAIDHYLLARLEEAQIRPVPDADRTTLIRRAFFTLIGLPPTPEEIDDFVSDHRPLPEAFAQVVDRLLTSPHFGERWGRHWLDVARFAESSGGGRSLMFKNAWRYRDYVIDAYNDDKPFDRFVREQIAGDLLPYDSPEQRAAQLTATGFLALGPTNYEQQDKELLRMEVIDEQIDTMGRAFLGLTLGCARCHDHKFDPIPTRDYYALAGIFSSTQTLIPGNVSGYIEQPLPEPTAITAARTEYQQKLEGFNQRLGDAKASLKALEAEASNDPDALEEASEAVKSIERLIEAMKEEAPAPAEVAMSVQDVEDPADGHLHIRGGVRQLGPIVQRGFVTVATSPSDNDGVRINPEQSGRLELAQWISQPENPLTARVYVNRVWRHLFGRGLVRTPDNHGKMGEKPTHPELLDHLALAFIADGWSTKKLIRRIMLSHVYRLSTDHDETAAAVDPQNRLLWRAERRRLDAEALRDAMLFVSGQLDRTRGGLTIRKITQYDLGYEFDTVRRSVYVPAFRNSMLELFEAFDFANPNLVIGHRNTSTLPTQALYLMNSPFVIEQSRRAAGQLLSEEDLHEADRIELAFRRALGRRPSSNEVTEAMKYLERFQSDDPAVDDRLEAWASLCHALFACLDFRYMD